jgi:hypothetical protein
MDIQDHLADYAKELRGNWQKFECFIWHRERDLLDPENWAVIYTSGRDSGLATQSNAAAIAKALEPFLEDEQENIFNESHSHWAVGYLDGYCIRVHPLDDKKIPVLDEYTPAFRKYCELALALKNYPILDEEDWSNRSYEATVENIKNEGRNLIKDGVEEDWAENVYSWLYENEQGEIEDIDDQGAYPSEDAIALALKALDMLDEEYAEA